MGAEPLTVVAIFRARPGHEAALREALEAMLAPTRDEPGCVNYDLHVSADDAALFFFHETWRSADDHQAHLRTRHVRHLLEVVPAMLLEPISELKARRIDD